MHEIAGVHHVAIGVENLEIMKSFYKDILGFNILEPPAAPNEIMSGIMRGVTPEFTVGMLSHDEGGIIIELIHMITPVPHAIRQDSRYGDIGANKITIAVSDVNDLYHVLKDKVELFSGPRSVELPGFGSYNFVYLKDPEGNIIELVSGAKLRVNNKFGGVHWVGISVTDLKRSVSFYQKYAGFDTLIVEPHEIFSGLVDEVCGSEQTRVRSCILSSGKGGGMVEFSEVLEPRGRSIPSYTSWGDFGYLHTAMICRNLAEIVDNFEKEGIEFFIKLQHVPGEEGTAFSYIRDPDGIPLEFLCFGETD
jgi:catechol 2,3-dioxygenase-like lactoylglutathione lyase family enzyme